MSLYMFRALNAHLQEDTLYTCSTWYCHSLREFVVACRCTDRPPDLGYNRFFPVSYLLTVHDGLSTFFEPIS